MRDDRFYLFLVLWFALIFGVALGGYWYQSCAESRIYNQQHDTNYSCGDFFWASEQINQSTNTFNVNLNNN